MFNMNSIQKVLNSGLFEVFQNKGFSLRFVGGCVRDMFLKKIPNDIDLVVDSNLDKIEEILKKKKIRIILKNKRYGSIKFLLNEVNSIQISSLRMDYRNFGRQALVKFCKEWHKDAKRRDFTINSLYLDSKKNLYDFSSGIHDIQKRIIRFIGDPKVRIHEDCLRILRYFRFYSHIEASFKIEPYLLYEFSNCYKHNSYLISKYHTKIEVLKLLSTVDPSTSLSIMNNIGIYQIIFGKKLISKHLKSLISLEKVNLIPIDPYRRVLILDIYHNLEFNKKMLKSMILIKNISNNKNLRNIYEYILKHNNKTNKHEEILHYKEALLLKLCIEKSMDYNYLSNKFNLIDLTFKKFLK